MKKRFLFLTLILAFVMSGCTESVPDMSTEQSAQVTGFTVGLLMKYDENHQSRLLNDTELEKELARLEALAARKAELASYDEALKEQKKKEKEEKEQALSGTPVVENGPSGEYVDDFYGIEGIDIRYTGYEITDSYPNSGDELFFSMQANAGKKLLVANFTARNTSDSEQTLDMISTMPSFKIGVNGGSAQHALSTLLLNDLANYRGTLAPGEETTLVLVAEIPEEKAANIETISLKMQNDSKSTTILMD